ncbi:MAG: response regulator [Patescibacteria group bacterium]|jgi:DNA-binding NtrC family response regulator
MRKVAPKNVWIVDSDEGVAEVIQTILQRQGYKVESISSNKNLQVKLRYGKPDVILLDVHSFDDSNGQELLTMCKECKTNKDTSLIAVSEDAEVAHCVKDYADVFIEKPFEIDNLLKAVKGELH